MSIDLDRLRKLRQILKENLSEEQLHYTKPSICESCKGVCCTSMAGLYHPSDFHTRITEEYVYGLLKTGKYKIGIHNEFEYGDEQYEVAYFLYPRQVAQDPYGPGYGGTCVNWSFEKGCSLQFKDRPFQCRKLIPHFKGEGKDVECSMEDRDKARKDDIINAWIPYADVLYKAGERLANEGLNVYPEEEGQIRSGRWQIAEYRKKLMMR